MTFKVDKEEEVVGTGGRLESGGGCVLRVGQLLRNRGRQVLSFDCYGLGTTRKSPGKRVSVRSCLDQVAL